MAIHNQSRTAEYLAHAGTPVTNALEGAMFVSDGSGGLVAGGLYFVPDGNTPRNWTVFSVFFGDSIP